MDDPDPRIDALFAGPPALFTKARDALAKELAAQGDRAGAAAARALRRPSALAAELNRLAREDPARIDAMLQAQDRLAGAQRRMLEGSGDATALRAAERAEADAIGPPAAAPAPPPDELAQARAKREARRAGSAPDDAGRGRRAAERAETLRAVTAALDGARARELTAVAERDAARERAGRTSAASASASAERDRLRCELAEAQARADGAESERAAADAALTAAQAAADEARAGRERAERAAREALAEASRDEGS